MTQHCDAIFRIFFPNRHQFIKFRQDPTSVLRDILFTQGYTHTHTHKHAQEDHKQYIRDSRCTATNTAPPANM